jgi:transposase-like protein
VYVLPRRDGKAARRSFEKAIGTTGIAPDEVVTDQAPTYPRVLDALLPAVWHRTDRYAINRIEADHSRLKARLGSMRGHAAGPQRQDRDRWARVGADLRRGHYELAVEEPANKRLAVAFAELPVA